MSNEIELKFEITEKSISDLRLFLNQWSSSNEAAISPHKPYVEILTLTNTYYDTTDYYLRDHHCGLRVRSCKIGQNEKYEITLKRDGKTITGLHERAEFNADLPNQLVDISVLPKLALPENCNITQLQQDLIPLFTTNFKRQTWLISFAKSEIEVALDQGEIISNGQLKIIQEVEMEIKQGNKIDLLNFAVELSRFQLHLFSQSKAARGYQLLTNATIQSIQFDPIKHQNLSLLLQFWQKNEEYALENKDIDFYRSILNQVERVLSVMPILSGKALTEWREKLTSLTSIERFSHSEINTQLKLMIMLNLEKYRQ